MKTIIKFFALLVLAGSFSSCSTVRVAADYEKSTDFSKYRTFAFFKPGVDQAKISDIDKRRILRAIEAEMLAKGYTKSEEPDLLVSIFTESTQRVDVYNNAWGMGWGPGWGNSVSTSVEGQLFIDLIDANKKELIWQGSGTGNITNKDVDRKVEEINTFVNKILEQFPPGQE
jgi:hypothetical protein